MCNYSVWVGGVEVNAYLLTESQANKLANEYSSDGYTDVCVEKIKKGN